MESSSNVLNWIYRKGNSTILITHNHELVDNFVANGIGLPQTGGVCLTTRRLQLIEGISRVSHAIVC